MKTKFNENEAELTGDGLGSLPDYKKKKKKKKGRSCCGCFLGVTISFVVLIVAAVGGGLIFANNYLKTNFGVSVGDAFNVLKTLYDGDRATMVTNAPTAEDEQAFYGAVGDSLYLKDGSVTADTIKPIIGSMSGDEGGESAVEAPVTQQLKAVRTAAEGGDTVGTLANLISRENADMERLSAFGDDYDFEANYEKDFVTTVTDRQLMSLVKGMISDKMQGNAMLEKLSLDQLVLAKAVTGEPVITLTASVNVEALVVDIVPQNDKIPAFAYKVLEKILPGEIFVDAEITMGETNRVRIVINKMSEENYQNAMKIISGALKLAGKDVDAQAFLDDTFNSFASTALDAVDEYIDLKKNIGDNGTVRFDLYTALSSALFKDKGVTGPELAFTYTSMLTADIDAMIKSNEEHLFENNYIVVDNGVEKVVYNATPADGDKPIEYKDEFIEEFEAKYLMRTEFYRDGIEASKVYLQPAYKYTDDGQTVIVSTPDLEKAYGGELPLDSEGKPLTELWYKPATESEDASVSVAEDATHTVKITILDFVKFEFKEVAALMGIGSSDKVGKIQLYSLFDSSGMRKELYKIDEEVPEDRAKWFVNQPRTGEGETLTFELTEKMLAALVDEQMGSIMNGGNALIAALDMKWTALSCAAAPETVALTATQADGSEVATGETLTVTRRYMAIGFETETEALFKDMSMLTGIVGDKIGLIVKVDITPELEDKYLESAVVEYCDLSASRTDKVLTILKKAGMKDLDFETISDQIAKPIRDAIQKMKTTFGEVTIKNGVMEVPDAFMLIKTQMFKEDESKKYEGETISFTADELQTVMRGLYNTPPIYIENKGLPTEAHFLTNGKTDDTRYERAYDESGHIFLPDNAVDGENHDNNKDAATRLNNLYHLKSSNSSDGVLALVAKMLPTLNSDLGDVVGYYDSSDVHGDYMFITFEYKMSKYLEGADANASLLDIDTVYATFRVNKSKWLDKDGVETNDSASADRYGTTLIINTMTPAERTELLKMMIYLSDDDSDASKKFVDLEKNIGQLAWKLETGYDGKIIHYVNDGTEPEITVPLP